jgi:hypothetical protein
VRTTVDLDPGVLERAKRLALTEKRTLGSLLNDAMVAYLGSRKLVSKDPPFELLVRGKANAPFPTPAELEAVEDEEEIARLGIPGARRRAAP